jgi:membrane associated rhomboid family serine protease
VRVWVLLFAKIPVRLSAMWVLGAWVVLQFWNVLAGAQQEIAWTAHIGGLIAGALLILIFRRPGVPLFDRVAGEA